MAWLQIHDNQLWCSHTIFSVEVAYDDPHYPLLQKRWRDNRPNFVSARDCITWSRWGIRKDIDHWLIEQGCSRYTLVGKLMSRRAPVVYNTWVELPDHVALLFKLTWGVGKLVEEPDNEWSRGIKNLYVWISKPLKRR